MEVSASLLDRGATVVVFDAGGGRPEISRAIRFSVLRKRSEANLAHLALHDSLTGLPNRALFLDRLGVALDRSRRTGGTVAVLFIDVDEFKTVNDTFGHAAGDRVLAVLGDRLRALLRPTDTISRFGGDEFTLLFEDLGGEREASVLVERLRRAAQMPIHVDGGEALITVSIGIAVVDDPTLAADAVIRRADAAMYTSKHRQRKRRARFSNGPRLSGSIRDRLDADLRRALERDKLRVLYQPRYAIDGPQQMTGFEALVRWEHPERGMIAPAEFIPIAEESGIMIPLGEYVVEQALRDLTRWHADRPELSVSLNVSPRQLEDDGFPAMLANATRTGGLDPGHLCLEIAETVLAHRQATAIHILELLKEEGLSVAIDDFGMGPSSLSLLERIPVDLLLIDPRFVGVVGHGTGSASVAGAVIELAHALGLTAVAEGVETDEQLAALRSLGCDEAQGFLFGRPVLAQDALSLVVPVG